MAATGKNKTKNFIGNWNELDDDFKDELVKLVEILLHRSELLSKKVNSKILNGAEYLEFVTQCVKSIKSEEIKKPQTILESTIKDEMSKKIEHCVDNYKEEMQKSLKDVRNIEELHKFHKIAEEKIIALFNSSKKIGTSNHSDTNRKKLEDEIFRAYKMLELTEQKKINQIEDDKRQITSAYEEQLKKRAEMFEHDKRKNEIKMKINKQIYQMLVEYMNKGKDCIQLIIFFE